MRLPKVTYNFMLSKIEQNISNLNVLVTLVVESSVRAMRFSPKQQFFHYNENLIYRRSNFVILNIIAKPETLAAQLLQPMSV